MQLSIGRAWSEGAEAVRRDGGLLFPVALTLIGLPSAIFQFIQPEQVPGQPTPPGPWMLFVLPLLVLSLLGSLSLIVLLTRDGVAVGEAVREAGKRFIPVLAAVLVFALAAAIIALPMATVSGMAAADPSWAAAALLVALVSVILLLTLGARLLLVNVVGALEPLGPVAILRRSWSLTQGHFWRLLGFIIILGLVFLVVTMAVGAVFGILLTLLLGPPTESQLAKLAIALVGGAVGAVFTVYFTAALTRIYRQLAGSGDQVSLSKGI